MTTAYYNHPLYNRWKKMIHRCHHEYHHKYPIYGARGITVCNRWRESFQNFLADIPPKPEGKFTLDRLDNDRGYEPGNVAWRTSKEQARNKTSNVRVELCGERRLLIEVCEEVGVSVGAVRGRLARGFNIMASIYGRTTYQNYPREVREIARHYR